MLNMTTQFSGANTSGREIPSAGVVSAKSTDLDILTVTTISGLNAKIFADTNKDGVLDSTTNVAHISLL